MLVRVPVPSQGGICAELCAIWGRVEVKGKNVIWHADATIPQLTKLLQKATGQVVIDLDCDYLESRNRRIPVSGDAGPLAKIPQPYGPGGILRVWIDFQ